MSELLYDDALEAMYDGDLAVIVTPPGLAPALYIIPPKHPAWKDPDSGRRKIFHASMVDTLARGYLEGELSPTRRGREPEPPTP